MRQQIEIDDMQLGFIKGMPFFFFQLSGKLCLNRCSNCCQKGHVGSETLLCRSLLVLYHFYEVSAWGNLYNDCRMVVVVCVKS